MTLPSSPTAVLWLDGGYVAVSATAGGQPVPMVLDTGFDQTSLGGGIPGNVPTPTTVSWGPVTAGPLAYGLLAEPGGVVGNDVLHQVPLVHDALQRLTQVLPSFSPAGSSDVPLTFLPTQQCRDGAHPAGGPLGPYSFLVPVNLDGLAVQMVLDTGAAATFLRTSQAALLSARPTLGGVLVSTPFAGIVSTTATRITALTVGSGTSAASPVLYAPEIDQELDVIAARLATACSALHCGQPPAVDGFLGWTFLREFQVSLANGGSPRAGRTLGLNRFATQTHWTRDFVGIGIITAASAAPAGLQILAFLSVSPARDAGLQVGDVITAINGVPAQQAPTPFAPVGTSVALQVSRGTQSFQVSVTVEDLLPNPP